MSENAEHLKTSTSRKKRLKELIDRGGEIRSRKEFEDSALSVKMISDIIHQNDEINKHGDVNERAQNTSEVVMDVQVIQMSHELVGEVMEKMGPNVFSDAEWINALINITFKHNIENWETISDIAEKLYNPIEFCPALRGSYDMNLGLEQTTQKKERQKRNRIVKGPEVRPENVEKINRRDGKVPNLVYNQIKNIYLETKQPIPYYQLIIDPKDFMKTVDNSFQVAFLIRDKSILLSYGDDGLAYVRPFQKKEKEECSKDTTHALCFLNYKVFQKMIEHYEINEAMLKYN